MKSAEAAQRSAHGLGPLLEQPGKFRTFREFWPVFVPSLTAMIGFWATLSLNMPDFTRFGRSQKEQVVGQVVALPTTMFAFAAMVKAVSPRIVLPGDERFIEQAAAVIEDVARAEVVFDEAEDHALHEHLARELPAEVGDELRKPGGGWQIISGM